MIIIMIISLFTKNISQMYPKMASQFNHYDNTKLPFGIIECKFAKHILYSASFLEKISIFKSQISKYFQGRHYVLTEIKG